MGFFLLRAAALIAGSAIAALTDIRTGLIPDRLTYAMVGLGLLLNLVELDFAAVLMGVAVFAIGYAFYFAGKIGGGDVKLFTGITLLLPFLEGFPFILAVLLLASLAAIIFLPAYYMLKYVRAGIEVDENRAGVAKSALMGVLCAFYLGLLLHWGFISAGHALLFAVPLLFALVFLAFERGIRKKFFLRKVALAGLDEDDLIAYDFLDEELKKKLGLGFKGIIDEKLKGKLEEMGVGEIAVYRNLPQFAPFVFIAISLLLAFPDILRLLMWR